jgi:hypothetical protein
MFDVFNLFRIRGFIFRKTVVHTCTVRYGTLRYSTVRYGTVRYSTVRYGIVQYGTVRYNTVRYGTVGYSVCYMLKLQLKSFIRYLIIKYLNFINTPI